MEKRILGRDGPEVSVLGFGGWPIGGGMGAVEEAQAIATVQSALDHGITLIDTAEVYRTSEELIGKALAGGRREQVFLATKVRASDLSRKHILEAIDQSLRNLRTDYVDLYQAHGWNHETPIEETMTALHELVEAGKARYVGVSNFNVAQMEAAWAVGPFQSLQPRYNLFEREIETEILPYCREKGIGILAHSPLAKGLLAGKYTPATVFPPDDERSRFPRFQGEEFRSYLARAERLKEIAAARGKTLVQLAIAWVLRDPAVTVCLVGAKSPDQVEGQVDGQGWRLTEEELRQIEAILTPNESELKCQSA